MTGRSSLSATVIYSKRLSGLKTGKGRMAVICERMAQQACYYNRTWPFVATAAELQNMGIGNSADRPAIVRVHRENQQNKHDMGLSKQQR